uniref:Leafy cotyledon1 n=1 Tax=Solanum tuberosum TaxID=4113 RepID=M1B1U9_SOLTU
MGFNNTLLHEACISCTWSPHIRILFLPSRCSVEITDVILSFYKGIIHKCAL